MGLSLSIRGEDGQVRKFTSTLGLPAGKPLANFLVDLIADVESENDKWQPSEAWLPVFASLFGDDLRDRLAEVAAVLQLPEAEVDNPAYEGIAKLIQFFERLSSVILDPSLPQRHKSDSTYEESIARCARQFVMALEDLRDDGVKRVSLQID